MKSLKTIWKHSGSGLLPSWSPRVTNCFLKAFCGPPHLLEKNKKQKNTRKSLCGIRLTIYFTKQTPSSLPTLTRKRQTTSHWDHLPEGLPSYYKGFPGVTGRAGGVTERSQHYWSAPPADSVRRQWNSRHVSPFYSFVTLNLSFSLWAKKGKCHCRARKPLHQSSSASDPSPSCVSVAKKAAYICLKAVDVMICSVYALECCRGCEFFSISEFDSSSWGHNSLENWFSNQTIFNSNDLLFINWYSVNKEAI